MSGFMEKLLRRLRFSFRSKKMIRQTAVHQYPWICELPDTKFEFLQFNERGGAASCPRASQFAVFALPLAAG